MTDRLKDDMVNVVIGLFGGGAALLVGSLFGEVSEIAFVLYIIIATKNL